jgi:hypothetical protein
MYICRAPRPIAKIPDIELYTHVPHLQCIIHFCERLFGLLEEAKDNRTAEFPLVFVVVHLEDLFEGYGVDAVSEVW